MARARRLTLQIDTKDLQILQILQRDGRVPLKNLAEAIGLTVTPCAHRVRQLELKGLIQGYRAVVDAQRVGSFVWAHTAVTLLRHRTEDFERFEAALGEVPEVLQCDAVGGGIDYLITVVARDVDHYQQIIENLLGRNVGLARYVTYIVTKRMKRFTALPLDSLIELR